MKLVIVSGRSGSGKSTALHQLEDLGYYCVDNLPVALLPELVASFRDDVEERPVRLAVGIDARNRIRDLSRYESIAEQLHKQRCIPEIVFLDARDDILLARFSSTRRRHPLSNSERSLEEALAYEKALLEPLAQRADLRVDSSSLSVHDLRESLKQRLEPVASAHQAVQIQSFAFKHGVPLDADLVFDARCLPNPHWEAELRDLTGRDTAVIEYLTGQALVEALYSDIRQFLFRWVRELQASDRSYVTVAIGCTGGQHRSVYLAERLYASLREDLPNLQLRHRELSRRDKHG